MILEPPPTTTPMLDTKPWLSGFAWVQWFQSIAAAFLKISGFVGALRLTGQGASLAATTILTVPETGYYRVLVETLITQAATTSSGVTVTFRWTSGGVAQAISGSGNTGNTTATREALHQTISADAGTVITFETAYASVGATAMQYRVGVFVEQIP